MKTAHVSLLIGILLALAPAAVAQTTWYVDDDAAGDPSPNDPADSDPLEDGSVAHPFDAIQEGIDAAIVGDQVQVTGHRILGAGKWIQGCVTGDRECREAGGEEHGEQRGGRGAELWVGHRLASPQLVVTTSWAPPAPLSVMLSRIAR